MSDFVVYRPNMKPPAAEELVDTRSAVTADADALAAVMATRGGIAEELVDRARTMIEKLDVLLIAEKCGRTVGWCGVQKYPIFPGAEPEWLIAGLTVIPEMRRRGIEARLLSEVLRKRQGARRGNRSTA